MIPIEDIMPIVKNTIATSIKCNTHRGYIGWSSCDNICMDCAQAKDRREYKKVTKQIAQLIKWDGNDTAKSLIEELKQKYPRRPALLDELGKVEKKL